MEPGESGIAALVALIQSESPQATIDAKDRERVISRIRIHSTFVPERLMMSPHFASSARM